MSAPSTYVRSFTSGSLSVADGTGSPIVHTSTLDRGDVVIGPLSAVLNEVKDVEARGGYKCSVYGKRIYPTIKFSAWFSSIDQDATAPGSLLEMVTQTGSYAANVSTTGAGTPYHVKTTLTIEGTDFGDSADYTIVCTNVRYSVDSFNETEDGYFISLTGTIKGSIVISNGTNTVTFAGAH